MPEAQSRPTAAEAGPSTVPAGSTPARWRATSLAVLVGGLAVGAAAAGGGGARWLVLGSIAIVVAGVIPVIVASRRPPVPPEPLPALPGAALPMVTVVVAARDEAGVVSRLVADIGRQDHRDTAGAPQFELVLIDDRSADGTGAATLAAAAAAGIGAVTRVIRREGHGLLDGKGAALAASTPEDFRGEMIVVLDADARVGPDFLRRIAMYGARGVGALTPRRRILEAGSSQLAGAQADEQSQDGELQRGRWGAGGCSEFRGNGITISRALLIALGGWPAAALTEDLDLSSRLAATTGVTVAWALDVEVWEEPVRRWGDLWRQRVRWSEGAIRRFLEHGPAVVRSPKLSTWARLDFAAYGTQLVAPPLIIGACLGAAATGALLMAVALLATYLAAGGILAFDALRWEEAGGRRIGVVERLWRAVRAAVFSFVWLAAVPAAMWRLAARHGRVRYDKMSHVGAAASFDAPPLGAGSPGAADR